MQSVSLTNSGFHYFAGICPLPDYVMIIWSKHRAENFLCNQSPECSRRDMKRTALSPSRGSKRYYLRLAFIS